MPKELNGHKGQKSYLEITKESHRLMPGRWNWAKDKGNIDRENDNA
jgi:hypothetical protein